MLLIRTPQAAKGEGPAGPHPAGARPDVRVARSGAAVPRSAPVGPAIGRHSRLERDESGAHAALD